RRLRRLQTSPAVSRISFASFYKACASGSRSPPSVAYPLAWVAPPPRCRVSPGPPKNGIQTVVTGEALTEDSLNDEGFVLTHSVRVEEQSYAVMLLTKPS